MKKLLTWVMLLLIIASCREIQEKDITDTTVELISPQDQYRSVVLNQTFYWNKVDGASGYRIQIATPSFAPDSLTLVLDSTTTKTQFSKSLPYGKKYQWRVMAINGGYDSKFTAPRTLYIDSSAFIAFQTVERISPAQTVYINKDNLVQSFLWTPLPQAVKYYFTLDSSGKEFPQVLVIGTSTSYTFKNQAQYTWDVVGYDNINTSSKNSTKFYINVDLTAPTFTSYAPVNKFSTTDNTIDLTWITADLPTYSGISTHYVYVYSDSANKTVYNGYNGKANSSLIEKLSLPKTSDTLWWKIKVEDKAFNSVETELRRLIISK
jgi:hypothetical protein